MSDWLIASPHVADVVTGELVRWLAEFDDGEEEDENHFDEPRQEPVKFTRHLLDALHINISSTSTILHKLKSFVSLRHHREHAAEVGQDQGMPLPVPLINIAQLSEDKPEWFRILLGIVAGALAVVEDSLDEDGSLFC